MTEIEPGLSGTLGKHEEVDVALRTDRLQVIRPVKILDQETGKEMMGLIGAQGDARLLPHDRAAAIGADDESAAHGALAALELVAHLGSGAAGDADAGYAAQHGGTGRHRGIGERRARGRMAQAERAGYAGE